MQPQSNPTFKLDRGSKVELNKVGGIRNLEFDMVTSIVFNTEKQTKAGDSLTDVDDWDQKTSFAIYLCFAARQPQVTNTQEVCTCALLLAKLGEL